MNAIEVKNISKSYGRVQALSDVSFAVGKGEVFGLIGPDGAGKTSMFRILCSLLLPDAGTAAVDGYDVVKQMREVRCRVGYMPGKFSLYQDLTIEENLNFFATLFGTTVEEGYDSIKGHLLADRTLQRPQGRRPLGWYEAETGTLVCIGTPTQCALPRRAHHGC